VSSSIRRLTHKLTKDERILKAVNKRSLKTAAQTEQLLKRVNLLKSLDHPNIIRVFEYFEDDKNYYFVAEYCSGGDLFTKITQQGYVSEATAAEYMRQILSVLTYLHSKGVIHRDLKPEHFLLDSSSETASLKLFDITTIALLEPGRTLTEPYGTAYYMAPEILAEHPRYDFKADVWSAGVMLYILLSGIPPFNGSTETVIKRKVKAGRFTFHSPEFDVVSLEGKDLITSMLTVAPAERPSAVEALRHPWILLFANKRPISDFHAQAIFNNIRKFRVESALHRAALSFIVSQFVTRQESADLFQIFKALDKNDNGTLSKAELTEGYKEVFPDSDEDYIEEEVNRIFRQVDINSSGEIEFSEFMMATADRHKLVSKERVRLAFEALDINHTGLLNTSVLKNIFGSVSQYNEDFWRSIIQEIDLNGDGLIDFFEFSEMMWKLTD
jgi:calcium-dependent protein kinase